MYKAFLFFMMLIALNVAVHAGEYHAQVKHADILMRKNDVILSADVDFNLSPQANEALKNGVPLFWVVKIKFQQKKHFWFYKTLLRKELHYRLQYHALLNMYRVKNENTGEVNSFSTLPAALNEMETVREFTLGTFENFPLDKNYLLKIKIIFEDEKLPLPLQTQVFANSQWQLSSDWTSFDLFTERVVN